MARTAAEMVAEAKKRVHNLTVEETAAELGRGDALLVDLREPNERAQHGAITGRWRRRGGCRRAGRG